MVRFLEGNTCYSTLYFCFKIYLLDINMGIEARRSRLDCSQFFFRKCTRIIRKLKCRFQYHCQKFRRSIPHRVYLIATSDTSHQLHIAELNSLGEIDIDAAAEVVVSQHSECKASPSLRKLQSVYSCRAVGFLLT